MTAFAAPLANVFALLGAGQTVNNGFGTPNVAGGGAASPFSVLLTPGQTLNGKATVSADTLLQNPAVTTKPVTLNGAAKVKINTDDDKAIGTANLLLSDLLAVNLAALQTGDKASLPNGWTLTAENDGRFTLANQEQGLAFPPFTKEQLDLLTQKITAGGADAQLALDAFDDLRSGEGVQKTAQESQIQDDSSGEKNPAQIVAKVQSTADTQTQDNGTNRIAAAGNLVRDTSPHAELLAAAAASARLTATMTGTPGSVAVKSVAAPATTAARLVPMTSIDQSGSLFAPIGGASQDGQSGMSFSGGDSNGFYQQFNLKLSGAGELTSGNSMPLSQLQVVIQKMAERGDAKSLMVQLDPAELGRVQVELSSGRDKVLRANILVEKPETLAALQKDMGALEKALGNAGITLDGNHISLDLAGGEQGQGNGFAQQAFQDLADERRRNKNSFDPDEILIASTEHPTPALTALIADTGVNITV